MTHVCALGLFRHGEHGCARVLQEPGLVQVLGGAGTAQGLLGASAGADARGWLWTKAS